MSDPIVIDKELAELIDELHIQTGYDPLILNDDSLRKMADYLDQLREIKRRVANDKATYDAAAAIIVAGSAKQADAKQVANEWWALRKLIG